MCMKEGQPLCIMPDMEYPTRKATAKLIPADVSINDVNNGYSLKEIYTSLGKLSLSTAHLCSLMPVSAVTTNGM